MTVRKRPKPNTANGRILAYLEEHGSITTLQVRSLGFSGNPSQRRTELRDIYGCRIDSELLHTDTGEPYCRWIFNGFRDLGDEAKPSSSLDGATLGTSRQSMASPVGREPAGESLSDGSSGVQVADTSQVRLNSDGGLDSGEPDRGEAVSNDGSVEGPGCLPLELFPNPDRYKDAA